MMTITFLPFTVSTGNFLGLTEQPLGSGPHSASFWGGAPKPKLLPPQRLRPMGGPGPGLALGSKRGGSGGWQACLPGAAGWVEKASQGQCGPSPSVDPTPRTLCEPRLSAQGRPPQHWGLGISRNLVTVNFQGLKHPRELLSWEETPGPRPPGPT